jgi:competence protein ComEC
MGGGEGLAWWALASLAGAWSAGIMLAVLMSPLWPWLLTAAAAPAVIAIVRKPLLALAGLSYIALLLGAARGAAVTTVRLPAALDGQTVTASGTVDDDPILRRGTRRLIVRLRDVAAQGNISRTDLRVQTTVYGPTPVSYGDLVLLVGELATPPRFGQFDYATYLANQGIAAVMPSARLIRVVTRGGDPFHQALFGLRHALVDRVDRALPEPQAGLVLGVVFGYQAALPAALQQQMIASGLVHIVVASGLNVALVARLAQQALGRLWRRAGSIIALAAISGYAVLSGASAASLRATLMAGLVILGGLIQRESQVFLALMLAAGLMLGIKPGLTRDVGFQLSFAATLGLLIWADPLSRALRWLPAALREALAATLAAQAMTWPLLLGQVHQLSLIAPIANLLVVPLVPFMMVAGGIGAAAATLVPPAGWLPLQASGAVARWFQAVIEITGGLPFAAVVTPYFPPQWLTAAAIINGGALAAIKLRRFFWQGKVWLALGGASLLAVCLLLVQPDGRVNVYALDVGTGSAVLVRTSHGQQLLIDGGPDPDRLTQSLGRVLPPTARSIDCWLITGGRRVEIGAAAAILTRFHVGRLVIADSDPWSASLRSVVQQAEAGRVSVSGARRPITLDDVVLTPAGDRHSWLIRTDRSVLVIVSPQTTWDSLPPGIDGAIFSGGGPSAWQGPGRGFSIIQVGANRADRLPVRAVLNALRGASLYRTDRLGTIELVATRRGFAPRID